VKGNRTIKAPDISGWTVHDLTVIRRHGRVNNRATWVCRCVCGEEVIESTERLINKNPGKLRRNCGKHSSLNIKPESNITAAIGAYKQGARRRGLSWEITRDQAITLFSGDCFYCGAKPSIVEDRAKGDPFVRNGIDRRYSDHGYTPENCVSCCSACNYFKRDLGYDEFLELIDKIYRRVIKNN
jgi:hypothetical protein